MNVTILGAGAFGSALGEVLETNGHTVKFYDPIKYPDIQLGDTLTAAEALIMAVPSHAVKKLLPNLPKDLPLIMTTKGFLSLSPFKDFSGFAVMSGGTFAADLLAKHPTTITGTSQVAKELFTNNWLTVEYSDDTRGVLICGSLKNIYAIGAGLKNLDRHTPEFNNYAGNVLSELYQILEANRCNQATANKSCGITDLIITSTPASRNFTFGRELAKNPNLTLRDVSVTTEGLFAAHNINNTPDFKKPSDTPILDEVLDRLKPLLQGEDDAA